MAEDGARVLVVVSALSGVTNELQAIANGGCGIDRAHRRAGRTPSRVLRRTRPRCRRGARRTPGRAAGAGGRSARGRARARLAGRGAGAGRIAVVDARRRLPALAGATISAGAMRATGWTRCRCRTPASGRSACRCSAGSTATRECASARFAAQAAPMLHHAGLHRPPRRRRHRDPRARRLGYLGRVLRRAAQGAARRDLDRRARACSAPIRATCPMRAC